MDPVPIPPQPASPTAGSATAAPPSYDQAEFRKRLSDEYKILQDKIDKIGAFRFTIKGWAIAIVGAVSASASAVYGPQTAFVISIILAVMVVFFFELEVEQIRLSRIFGERAKALENLFTSIDRGRRIDVPPPVPHTAHEIAKASYQRELANKKRSQIGRLRAGLIDLWRVGRFAHRRFYIVLFALTFLPMLRHSDEIGKALQ